jgi:hypothetical protein
VIASGLFVLQYGCGAGVYAEVGEGDESWDGVWLLSGFDLGFLVVDAGRYGE